MCAFYQQRSVVPGSPDIRLGEIGRVPNTVRMYQSGEPDTAELDMCQESHDALWWTLEGALVLRQ